MLRKIYRQERIPYEESDDVWQNDLFDEEWREHILKCSMEKLKDVVSLRHYQIFYMLDVRHCKVKTLAEMYRMPPVSIYSIRNRVEAKLREIVRQLDV